MRAKFLILSLIASGFFHQSLVIAQQKSIPEKKNFVDDSTGRYYQNATLPVYLWISSSKDQSPMNLQSLKQTEVILEGHGVHALRHENNKTNSFDEFQIFADGRSPVTSISFEGAPVYSSKGQVYYGSNLKVSLKASDEMSGVDKTFYSVNQDSYSEYRPTDFLEEGEYLYQFYSTDKTGNVEETKSKTFVVDIAAPETYHNFINISSENVISVNSSIYLSPSDNGSGISKTFFKFDDQEYSVYKKGNIPFQYLDDGNHVLTYYSVDHVNNKEEEKSFKFYLDKTAPIMSADILGDKFIVGERVYFSGRTKLKLTAVDNKSGIKEIMYSLNDQEEQAYSDPFYLPNRSGIHNVKFRALDNTNNPVKDDFEHSVGVIYLDLTGPTINHSFNGPVFKKADTVFISSKTEMKITGNDPEAGLKLLSYSVNGSAEEIPYEEAFEMPSEGFYEVDYFGYDNVNNKNSKQTFLIVDNKGPEISYQFAVPPTGGDKYPSYSTIYLAAIDSEVGVSEIQYSINGGKKKLYSAPIKGLSKNKKYIITSYATDFLGNETESKIEFETDSY
ncbi:MAG: Ig-like domain repeat protein [Bacteroidota bacterium]